MGPVKLIGEDFFFGAAFGALADEGRKTLICFEARTVHGRAHRSTPLTAHLWIMDRIFLFYGVSQYNSAGKSRQQKISTHELDEKSIPGLGKGASRLDPSHDLNGGKARQGWIHCKNFSRAN